MRKNNKKQMIWGGLIAGGIQGGIQLYQGYKNQKAMQEQEEEQKNMAERESKLLAANQSMSQLPPPVAYTPTFQTGGAIPQGGGGYHDYSAGQSHAGPDGGIPVDAQGQPSVMSGNPEVALTEKGEVTFNGFVYSDELKLPGNKKFTFADEAKRIKRKYEFYLGKKLDKKEPISRKALEKELERLMMVQETVKGNTITKEDAAQQAQMAMEQAMMQQEQMGGMEQGLPPGAEGMPQEEMSMMQEELPTMNEGGTLYDDDVAFNPKPIRGLPPTTYDTQSGQFRNHYTRGVYKDESGNIVPDDKFYDSGLNLTPSTSSREISENAIVRGNALPPTSLNSLTPRHFAQPLYAQPIKGVSGKREVGTKAVTPKPKLSKKPIAGAATDFQGGVPWTSMIPGLVTSAAQTGLGLLMDKKPENIRLGRMTPQQLSLERGRISDREQNRSNRNAALRRMRDYGVSAGSYMAGAQNIATESERMLGERLGQSYEKEAGVNLQLRQQAAEVNRQASQYEQTINQQRIDDWKERRRHYVSSGLSNVAGTFQNWQDQDRHSTQFAQWLNMMSPDYKMRQEGKGRKKRTFIVARNSQ
jgi:hypothetical protein